MPTQNNLSVINFCALFNGALSIEKMVSLEILCSWAVNINIIVFRNVTQYSLPDGYEAFDTTSVSTFRVNLGLLLDRRLTGHKHFFEKRKQLGITLIKMYWFFGRKSKLSTSNKRLIYKAIFKPIWTYGIQLWGTASTYNIGILEHFQSKALRMLVRNTVI
jgi:hypothetical protein